MSQLVATEVSRELSQTTRVIPVNITFCLSDFQNNQFSTVLIIEQFVQNCVLVESIFVLWLQFLCFKGLFALSKTCFKISNTLKSMVSLKISKSPSWCADVVICAICLCSWHFYQTVTLCWLVCPLWCIYSNLHSFNVPISVMAE